jgi:hypothetical protein
VNSGSVWYVRAPPLAARGFTLRRCRNGEIWRSESVSPSFVFCFFFLMAVMGVSYYLQTKENLKH